MINHLVNDIAVMGATPLYVQDAVICGKLEKKVVTEIVKSIANACKAQGCILTGGETSEQPGVLQPGVYVLTSSIIGIVEKSKVIDGSSISEGDTILALASNGLHTNGYTLVRALMKENPALAEKKIGEETFLDAILKPHVCYFQAIKTLFDDADLHGMAHITGSGIEGNLERILPKNLDAQIDLSTLRVLPIFNTIQKEGNVSDSEMLRTYNMGVGLTLVVKSSATARIMTQIKKLGHDCYPVGNIVTGKAKVKLSGAIHWPS
jgi:phosphoribosylformylglycinamidine cyclo-ligase